MSAQAATKRMAMVAVLALAVSVSACGSSGSDSSSASDASATTTAVDSLPPGTEDLVGRYAHFDIVAYEDAVLKTLIISTGYLDLEMRDGELWNVQRFCHADTVVDQDMEVSISDAATSAIIPVDTPVEVTEVDGKLHVSRPATPTAIGIKLDDPANDVLPTDPDDPRIFDADGDGNPGVTSSLKFNGGTEGEIYIARREIFAYDVTQETADRLVGTITDSSEQLIVGASDPIFLAESDWKQIEDEARNPVIWQRVADDFDCEQLAAQRDDLFPPNPAADW